MTESPLLRVENVHKRFGAVHAVAGLDFTLRPGEILALLGPNGAGKTTMVRMLVGILRPDDGRVLFHPETNPRAHLDPTTLGYLPEERGLYREASVLRTLEYFGVLRGLDHRKARRRGQAWLERFALADRADAKVDTLSKGNQQKVQLAAAMLHEPRLAVLDEPFSGLDPVNQQQVLELLRDLRERGATILLSSHQMDLVERAADRLLLMNRGRSVLQGSLGEIRRQVGVGQRLQLRLGDGGTVDTLRDHPAVRRLEPMGEREVRLWLAEGADLSGLLRAVGERVPVEGIRTDEVGLHDIFVEAVR